MKVHIWVASHSQFICGIDGMRVAARADHAIGVLHFSSISNIVE